MIVGKLLSHFISPRKALAVVLKPYGVSKVLRADITPGCVDVTVLLEGEPAPIDLLVHASLRGNSITIHDLSCDRPWIEKTAKALVVGQSYTLPEIALEYLAPLAAAPEIQPGHEGTTTTRDRWQ